MSTDTEVATREFTCCECSRPVLINEREVLILEHHHVPFRACHKDISCRPHVANTGENSTMVLLGNKPVTATRSYRVSWVERTRHYTSVEAANEGEAIDVARNDGESNDSEFIESEDESWEAEEN
jgi:hypothetical protein